VHPDQSRRVRSPTRSSGPSTSTQATSADAHIARIFLSGGSSKIPALVKTIEGRTGVPVEVMNPFRNIDIGSGKFDPDYLQTVAPMAAVSVGLALRYPADK
jgi:type IV pilus assembly protein PilM